MEEQKAKLYKYLKADRSNHDILRCKDKDTGREMLITVSSSGEIYDKKGAHIGKSKQKRFWQGLFDLALLGEYNIVPDGFFDSRTEKETT